MIRRVAYLSMHTSPLAQPGVGHAGGMNVYIHELACTMADRGIEAVVFTRREGPAVPEEIDVEPNYRVVHVDAGPQRPVPLEDMPDYVAAFTEGVTSWAYRTGTSFDLVHSHYWLSGWAGVLAKEQLGVPLANSFHTLGRVKDIARRDDEPPSSPMRTLTEAEIIARSDCVIASTPHEFDELVDHYGASPERLCTSPPGIDHKIFTPGDQKQARSWLGLGPGPLVLFVGRIQPHKGVDVAVRAAAGVRDAHLVIVGGPSDRQGNAELDALHRLVGDLGVGERVHFIGAQPHEQLADFYRAADVLIMPSRSETFGLVAAEAQACGLPVVAARVGGLPYVVADQKSGLLVDGHSASAYAIALQRIVTDTKLAAQLRDGALVKAEEFSWPATADRLVELYEGITAE